MCYTGVSKTSRRWKTFLCKDAHMDLGIILFLIIVVVACDRLEKKWNDDEPK